MLCYRKTPSAEQSKAPLVYSKVNNIERVARVTTKTGSLEVCFGKVLRGSAQSYALQIKTDTEMTVLAERLLQRQQIYRAQRSSQTPRIIASNQPFGQFSALCHSDGQDGGRLRKKGVWGVRRRRGYFRTLLSSVSNSPGGKGAGDQRMREAAFSWRFSRMMSLR